jgi:hypothetical protein
MDSRLNVDEKSRAGSAFAANATTRPINAGMNESRTATAKTDDK